MGISDLPRYGDMGEKGEYVYLRGYPCINPACMFCKFPQDNSTKTEQMVEFNKSILDLIHGRSKQLEVYNFGSIFEIPPASLFYLRERVDFLGIESIVTDAHWKYREQFSDMRRFFEPATLRIKIGVETFDRYVREDLMKKGMGDVTPAEVRKYTDAINLLVGFKGQTHDMILQDLKIAEDYFSYADVNVIDPEFAKEKIIDFGLVKWFISQLPEFNLSDKLKINYQVS